MNLLHALILGIVEGLTEFIPVSSTGHLILTGAFLGLGQDEATARALDAFDIVIQAGAWLAAVLYYWPLLRRRLGGVLSTDVLEQSAGLRLLMNLMLAFIPVVIVGLAARKFIKATLFGPAPVAVALAVGGVAMIIADGVIKRRAARATTAVIDDVDGITMRSALIVGLWQCLALIPGTSRSMATMLGGMWTGMSTRVAADFSFLLAIPVLGAATAYELMKEWTVLIDGLGGAAICVGLAASFVVGWASIAVFLRVIVARGLMPFGVYRVVLAAVVWWTLIRPGSA
jgi:undecaprenyl-diphosphatase